MSILFPWILSLALADPQDLPEENDSNTQSDQSSEETLEEDKPSNSTEETETPSNEEATNTEDLPADNPDKKPSDIIVDPKSDPEDSKEEDRSSSLELLQKEDLSLSEFVKLSKDLAILAEQPEEEEDSDDFDFEFLRGSLEYTLNFHYWKMSEEYLYFNSASINGDPQYIWNINDNVGALLGLRFRVRSIENREAQLVDHLIGLTTGVELGPIRINTAGSYYNHQSFYQQQILKDAQTNQIIYSYQELPRSQGILWEQTVHFSPDDGNFFLEGRFAFPFQLKGEREMGEPFSDAWRANVNIGFASWLLGYEHNLFPNSTEHVLLLGNSLHF